PPPVLLSPSLFFLSLPPPTPTLFPYTTLFRSYPYPQFSAALIRLSAADLTASQVEGVALLLNVIDFSYSMSESISSSSRHASPPDRKSTRLNSSHVKISYAVFCLKKKNMSR